MLLSLRLVARIVAIIGLLATAACTPAAPSTPPTPTGATTKPAASPAATTKSADTDGAPAKSAPAPAAKAPASSDWKAEWDKTVEAAKKEGKVVIAGPREALFRNASEAFKKSYPDIQMDYVGFSGSDFAPKLLAEREGGQYLWDVHIGGGNTPLRNLKPKGALDPIKPILILPDEMDDSKWLGGFDDGWLDSEKQYVYQFMGYLSFVAYVNRDIVPESELNALDQLLDPKWKGKIVSQDPRSTGAMGLTAARLLMGKKEDWLRKLLAQNLVVVTEGRQVAEGMVRGGRTPIGMGLPPPDLEIYRSEGLGKNVQPLAPEDPAASQLTGGSGGVALLNKAPHPNAAKVFINWLLSQEGQKAHVASTNISSRRLDAPGGPAISLPRRDVKYTNVMKEENQPTILRANEIAREYIK